MITVLASISHKNIREGLQKTFSRTKAEFITCRRPYASIVKARQYTPDVIIIEILECTQDELSIIRLIRKHPEICHTPLLVFGPACSEQCRVGMEKMGVTTYVAAPISVKKILLAVQVVLRETMTTASKKKNGENPTQDVTAEMTAQLFDPQVLPTKKIALMVSHIDSLVAFPTTFASVLRLTEDNSSSASQLGRAIESDSSVAAEILRLANSVYYAARNRRIDSLRQAIVRIGFSQTKTAVLSMSVLKHFNSRSPSTGFSYREFWFHSLAVAIIAEKLAKKISGIRSDEAFALGLLHGLGALMMNEYLPTTFQKILDGATEEGSPFTYYQDSTMSVNHLDLLAYLFTIWKLPNSFSSAIRIFDRLHNTASDVQKNSLAVTISLAKSMAYGFDIGYTTDCSVHHFEYGLLHTFGIHKGITDTFIHTLYSELNLYNSIVNIDDRTYPRRNKPVHETEKISLLCCFSGEFMWSALYEYIRQSDRYSIRHCEDVQTLEQVLSEQDAEYIALFPAYTKDMKKQLQLCDARGVRGLVMDVSKTLRSIDFETCIIAEYPVDLRNVHMVLQALNMNSVSNDMSDRAIKYLLPLTKGPVTHEKRNALVVYRSTQGYTKLYHHIKRYDWPSFNKFIYGHKALQYAKDSSAKVTHYFLEWKAPFTECAESLQELKKHTGSQNAQYIVFYEGVGEESSQDLHLLSTISDITLVNLADESDCASLHTILS
ncbi:HDOD domain-containing protein [Chitinivibrio alkaliphilus]|uniref:HDOD domain-containing protein n=1 Tax=Chitinivibrio alkaliphilus ACht1 TaxID=1313304 RepID=U7DBB2_9BACT|nr:HDOD domain-containing protein [Chitinivibrio alkaliphilus]ERP39297.1 hypothetical protein CALK_0090 [Chitinivibrio alkaliphilus ACht1]